MRVRPGSLAVGLDGDFDGGEDDGVGRGVGEVHVGPVAEGDGDEVGVGDGVGVLDEGVGDDVVVADLIGAAALNRASGATVPFPPTVQLAPSGWLQDSHPRKPAPLATSLTCWPSG